MVTGVLVGSQHLPAFFRRMAVAKMPHCDMPDLNVNCFGLY